MEQQIFTKLIQIGNSHGVRLPKNVIEKIGLTGDLVLEVREGEVVLKPKKHPRDEWDAGYKLMLERGGDRLSDDDKAWLDLPTKFDDDEWEW